VWPRRWVKPEVGNDPIAFCRKDIDCLFVVVLIHFVGRAAPEFLPTFFLYEDGVPYLKLLLDEGGVQSPILWRNGVNHARPLSCSEA
jgi:hypothetical protein